MINFKVISHSTSLEVTRKFEKIGFFSKTSLKAFESSKINKKLKKPVNTRPDDVDLSFPKNSQNYVILGITESKRKNLVCLQIITPCWKLSFSTFLESPSQSFSSYPFKSSELFFFSCFLPLLIERTRRILDSLLPPVSMFPHVSTFKWQNCK